MNLDEKLITGVSSQYYSTPDGLNSAVVASYAQLRGFYGREQLISLTQVGTDTWMAADQAGLEQQGLRRVRRRPELAPSRRSPTRGIPRTRRSTR